MATISEEVSLTSRVSIFQGKLLDPNTLRPVLHPLEKFPMITWSVRAEILQDFREWRLWHFDLEEVVTERNLFLHIKVVPDI